MKVFKFGGASVKNAEGIKNVAAIVKFFKNEQLVVIVSAMGKTTNALEKVVEAFFDGRQEDALQLFSEIKENHLAIAQQLLVKQYNETCAHLKAFFTEVEWLLHDRPVQSFDYYYDQVVCIGELLSTAMVSAYFIEVNLPNKWVDVRDVLRTDNNFRDGIVDLDFTAAQTAATMQFSESPIFVTQGFIGSTDQNESTTLGREGSDYTASIFANLLGADSLTIWKDVKGVMSADPKAFPQATLISELSFNEVIEMAFYGAQVIHPKTIKPLQNKGIPLLVKSFVDPALPGTIISSKVSKNLPPVIVLKEKQVLVNLQTQDFSFVGEKPMSTLYQWFEELKIKPNLIQTAAINVQLCLDDRYEKIDQLAVKAGDIFDVQLQRELTLLTIRHYTPELLNEMTVGKNVLLTQKTKETVQVLYE